ncbi:MAG: hypothetical protein JWM53_2532 [bacterium]|nr:hypothetical protein [bacterium]
MLLDQVMCLPYAHAVWRRLPIGSVSTRMFHGIFPYPHYAYGAYWSAFLARQLGVPRITAVEFGVAGGRGLVALQDAAQQISGELGVGIDVVGFDSGGGMPPPVDYRDLPHIWGEGFYKMDADKLRARLTSARLILGDVRDTVPELLATPSLAPIGFVAFDLDYYSSTKAAFGIFGDGGAKCLPRVHCYFDDVASNDLGCMNEYVGELLAIREYNESHPAQKICKFENLRLSRPRWEDWQEKMYVHHNFGDPRYATQVIPLEAKHIERPL